MTIRPPLTLPAYTPTSWELRLPGYPVVTGGWRGAAFPEIHGWMPSEAAWSLLFENVTAGQAIELLLPWRASGGGQWPLTDLPAEVAMGVDDENFRKRLVETSWTIARKPKKESVKNGRFNITIDLVHELTFDSRYGPLVGRIFASTNPAYINEPIGLAVAALPSGLERPLVALPAGPSVQLDMGIGLSAIALPSDLVTQAPPMAAQGQIELALGIGLEVAEVNPTQ